MAEPRVYRLQRNGEDLGAPPETDEAILLFAADSIGCRLSGDWGGKAITVDRGGVVFIGTPPREVRTQDGATLSSDHDVVLSRVTASGRLQLGAGIVIEELAAEDASVTAISGSKTATVNRVTGSATFIGPGTFHVPLADPYDAELGAVGTAAGLPEPGCPPQSAEAEEQVVFRHAVQQLTRVRVE